MAKLSPVITWNTLVGYETAICLLSTRGDNARASLDALNADDCDTYATGAWYANEVDRYVAYRSAAAHKRASAETDAGRAE